MLPIALWRAFDVGAVGGELYRYEHPEEAFRQAPLRAPSVFNFFRHGYVAPGTETGAAGMTAPELQIVNASSTPGYANFMTYFVAAGTTDADTEEVREIFREEGIDPGL